MSKKESYIYIYIYIYIHSLVTRAKYGYCIGISKIPTWRGSPWGLPHSEPYDQGFFPMGIGTGAGAGIGRGPRLYEKTILPLMDIYIYFYDFSHIFI